MTERVDGRTRWRLMDGFRRVPALSFSATEIMALVLSRDLLKPLEGTQLEAAVNSALAKMTSVLPPAGLDFVRQMQEFFSVGLGPHKAYARHRQVLERLSRAVAERRTVQMRYYSASRGRVTRREVDPYHLWFAAGGLYLIAYCHRRRDVRMFAVERIRSLTVTAHPFQLPLGFDVEAYVEDALVVMRGRLVEVELAFDRATAAWARDRIWHPSQTAILCAASRELSWAAAGHDAEAWKVRFVPLDRAVPPPPGFDGAAARCWESVTLYVPPRHHLRKGKERARESLTAQIRRELVLRGFSAAEQVEAEPVGDAAWVSVHVPRTEKRAFLGDRRGYWMRLIFPEPVRGPLRLGHSSSFGLGLFRPSTVDA